LEEKLELQKRVKEPEGQRREEPRALFDAQDGVDRRRDDLTAATEAKRLSLYALLRHPHR